MVVPLTARVEQKYFVAPARIGCALALLRRTCRWDGDYPEEQINSLYFDTADLDQHERSLAGEFTKDKIRIRWYGGDHGPHMHEDGPARVWLELKSRRGFSSTKQRRLLEVPGELLRYDTLSRGIVSHTTLMQTVTEFGFGNRGRLQPVITISYWRQRFVEPRTGFRVALDSHIRSSMVMPGIGRGERDLELPGAVVEVKGSTFDLPARLRQVAELGSSWTRYSKYSSSLEAHRSDLGSASRLWPSGTLHAEPCTGMERPTREVTACGNN